MPSSRSSDLQLFRRVLSEARPYWAHIAVLFSLSLLATPLALLSPLPLKIAVDSAIGSDPLPRFVTAFLPESITTSRAAILTLASLLVVAIAILSQLQSMTSTLLRTYTGEKLMLDFRARVFRHVQRLSMSYHDSKGTWDSTYRIQYDTAAVQYIAIDGLIPFVSAAFTLVSMLYVCFRLDWQLALVAVAVSPALFLLARIYRKRLRQQYRDLKQIDSEALSVVQEVLSALRVVKAFGQEDREQQRFVRHSNNSLKATVKVTTAEGVLGLLMGITTASGTAAVLLIGGRHVQSGSLTLGELLLIMGYLGQLYGPLKTISNKIATLQSHLESAERAYAVLEEKHDVPDRTDGRRLKQAVGGISFDRVTFRYDEGRAILADVSIDIAPGSCVGIVGTTGVGKTTLVSLLMRFYDPSQGVIRLDNVDLREYKLADLRNQFAIIQQEPVLFSSSIKENIAYSQPNCSDQAIVAAARAANAHQFITELPDGYDTLVGERGMRLSGGERQRIALARAFLKDAPILILDEPTSSVDVRTEAGIMSAVERLVHHRTTFMVAHRLSTLERCDLLLRLEGGKVAIDDKRVPDSQEVSK